RAPLRVQLRENHGRAEGPSGLSVQSAARFLIWGDRVKPQVRSVCGKVCFTGRNLPLSRCSDCRYQKIACVPKKIRREDLMLPLRQSACRTLVMASCRCSKTRDDGISCACFVQCQRSMAKQGD